MATPILLCDTYGMPRERWLECRRHGPDGSIPITLGGSDVAAVFGASPWKAPLELWREKAGLYIPPDSNDGQMEMGNLMEPIVAHWYEKRSGIRILKDTGLYQHGDYPFALANVDYLVIQPDGLVGILECKTTSYRNAMQWSKGVPYHYELQVRFYMAVRNLPFADIACLWGNNPETDMALYRIDRDIEIENRIFHTLQHFVASIQKNEPPTMDGISDELAYEALARLYKKSVVGLDMVEFDTAEYGGLCTLSAMQAELRELNSAALKKKKEIEKRSAPYLERMGEHEHGILQIHGTRVRVKCVSKTKQIASTKKLKDLYPHIHAAISFPSISRSLEITVEDGYQEMMRIA